MKTSNFLSHLLLGIVLCVAMSGCKKGIKGPTPIFPRTAGAPTGSSVSPIEPGGSLPPANDPRGNLVPGGLNTEGQNALGPRPDMGDFLLDRDVFKQQTVYFEFDRSNVKPGELPKVQSVASHMKGEPGSVKLLVEGHCDERGTPEYNRALGERRALAIREALISLGMSGDRIQTVSYGEDKPADPGHDKEAWAKNRRAEFILLRPKPGGAAADAR
jgi:peptidoglycan-associated lipoprotein